MIRSVIIGVLAATVFAVGAVPAFTADSGGVSITVIGQPPPAPCLLVSPDPIDFGTLAFSKPGTPSSAGSTSGSSITSCSTAPQNVSVSGTDASGSSGNWELGWSLPGSGNPCDAPVDTYFLWVSGAFDLIETRITKAPKLLETMVVSSGLIPGVTIVPAVWHPGQRKPPALFRLAMPCQGSNGPGEPKTLTVTFTGIVV